MSRTPSARPRREPSTGNHAVAGRYRSDPYGGGRHGRTTLTAVVRDALKAYLWLVAEQQRHRRIISEDPERGDRIQLMPLLRVTAL